MSDSYSKSVVSGIRYKYNKIYIGQEVQLAADFIWYRNNIPPEKKIGWRSSTIQTFVIVVIIYGRIYAMD